MHRKAKQRADEFGETIGALQGELRVLKKRLEELKIERKKRSSEWRGHQEGKARGSNPRRSGQQRGPADTDDAHMSICRQRSRTAMWSLNLNAVSSVGQRCENWAARMGNWWRLRCAPTRAWCIVEDSGAAAAVKDSRESSLPHHR